MASDSQDLRDRLQHVSCASLVDALAARYPHRAHILDLVSPTPGAILCGQAVTIRYFPARDDVRHPVKNDFASLFYQAIQDGGTGKVLVMGGGGCRDAAFGGSRKLARLRHHGLAGVLTEGRLRDFEALRTYDFVTYCRGEAVAVGGNAVMPVEANVPVEVAGIGVLPGDYIVADRAGTVVIPEAEFGRVLDEAADKERRDAASAERMVHEDPATVIAKGEQ